MMTRRQMFKAVGGVGVAAVAGLTAKRPAALPMFTAGGGQFHHFGPGTPVRLTGHERILFSGILTATEARAREEIVIAHACDEFHCLPSEAAFIVRGNR